jgi:hypothetical protein
LYRVPQCPLSGRRRVAAASQQTETVI